MQPQAKATPERFLNILRVVGLAGFALLDPPVPGRVLGLALLWVGLASFIGLLRTTERAARITLLVGTAAVDLAWVAAAMVHFGPLGSLPAVLYAVTVAGLTSTISWGGGVVIGCLGALLYYTLMVIYRSSLGRAPEQQLLTFQAAVIAIAGILSGYISGQASRLKKTQELAGRLQRLNAATAEMVNARGDEPVLQMAVGNAVEMLNAARAWLMLADPADGTLALDAHIGVSPPPGMPETVALSSGVAGTAIRAGGPSVAADLVRNDPRLSPVEAALAQDQLAAAPIPGADGPLGVVEVSREPSQGSFTDVDLAVLATLARSVGATLQTGRLLRDLRQSAGCDSLTGLYNHGAFLEQLAEQIQGGRRTGRELSLIILDVDQFKRVNDVAGHWEGDRVLQALADTLRRQCRGTDAIARCGGDEFAVLLPGTGANEAAMIAERVATALSRAGEEMRLAVPVTASWGVACFPWDAEDEAGLFRKADARLYETKQGRQQATPFQNIVA